MKSYLDILEACLSENVEGTGGDVVGIVSKNLRIDRKAAEERIGDLSIVTAAEIADAASQGDPAAIVLKMGGKAAPLAEQAPLTNLPKGDVIPPNADYENWDGTIIDGGPQPGNPPLFDPNDPDAVDANGKPIDLRTRQLAQQAVRQGKAPAVQPATATKPGQPNQQATQTNRPPTKPAGTVTQSQGTRPPLAEYFSAGDEVIVGGKIEGVVSGVDDGPANSGTIGVLIKGSLEMVKKDNVKMAKDDKKIDEHVLGFSNIGTVPGMRQMMELAMFTAKKDEDEIDAEIDAAGKEPVEDKAEEAKVAQETEEKVDAEAEKAEQPAAAPAGAPAELLVFDISAGTQSNVAQPAEPAAKTAVGTTTAAQEPEDPREQILKALDVIERNMPDLRMADFRDVRARLDKVSNVVLERAMNRRPKL